MAIRLCVPKKLIKNITNAGSNRKREKRLDRTSGPQRKYTPRNRFAWAKSRSWLMWQRTISPKFDRNMILHVRLSFTIIYIDELRCICPFFFCLHRVVVSSAIDYFCIWYHMSLSFPLYAFFFPPLHRSGIALYDRQRRLFSISVSSSTHPSKCLRFVEIFKPFVGLEYWYFVTESAPRISMLPHHAISWTRIPDKCIQLRYITPSC